MHACTVPSGLCVAELPGRGRGVLAARSFAAGERIEVAPVLVVPRSDAALLQGRLLDSYWFWWDEGHNALGLGCASLYNHACPANARFDRDVAARTLTFTAVRDLVAGEEITINYHGEPDDPSSVWFDLA
ncbi:MAG: SET domain-containing protein-lysine N-methyltransferase [Planctomycetes bacterium]|nr:SET domain-containing protein-lysine N-methyltransferase [Planctomycetota bacterium]